MNPTRILELKKIALQCRMAALEMLAEAGSGHPGSSLSVMDLLVYLLFEELDLGSDPSGRSLDRDRLVLSKGHAVPALYSVLAARGFLPKPDLLTLRKPGSYLQGHPDRVVFPWMDASTGSLGQGLSVAQGIALGFRLRQVGSRVVCIMGDGEIQEGQVWEAALSVPKYQLHQLTAIVDYNHGQIDGTISEVMELEPLVDKWKSFRWNVLEVDGHDFSEIGRAFEKIRASEKPSLMVAHTVKGKGVSFMEHQVRWHGIAPTPEEARRAVGELQTQLQELRR